MVKVAVLWSNKKTAFSFLFLSFLFLFFPFLPYFVKWQPPRSWSVLHLLHSHELNFFHFPHFFHVKQAPPPPSPQLNAIIFLVWGLAGLQQPASPNWRVCCQESVTSDKDPLPSSAMRGTLPQTRRIWSMKLQTQLWQSHQTGAQKCPREEARAPASSNFWIHGQAILGKGTRTQAHYQRTSEFISLSSG